MKKKSPLLFIILLLFAAVTVRGQYSFDPITTINTGTGNYTYGVVSADLNKDGYLDLVTDEANGDEIQIWFNNGDGSYGSAQYIKKIGTVTSFAFADYNNDGYTDIATITYPTDNTPYASILTLLINNPDNPGTFEVRYANTFQYKPYIVTLKADQDANADLLIIDTYGPQNSVEILKNDGNANFTGSQQITFPVTPRGSVIKDFNGDGYQDFLTLLASDDSQTPAHLVVYSNDGSGHFEEGASIELPPATYVTGLTAADLNKDGLPEIVYGDENQAELYLVNNKGNNQFDVPVALNIEGGTPFSIADGDFNGDGYTDLVSTTIDIKATSPNLGIQFLTNNPKAPGSFTRYNMADPLIGTYPSMFATSGDLNNDGLTDLMTFGLGGPYFNVMINSTTALPIELKSFGAILKGISAYLSWNTGLENGLKSFNIQKSLDAAHYKTVSKQTPMGSNSKYSFTYPQAEATAYYRLEILFDDGHKEYSKVRSVENPNGRTSEAVTLYPNPATSYVQVNGQKNGPYSIFDATGRAVQSGTIESKTQKIDIRNLSSGVYYIKTPENTLHFIKK